jgi:hypothetical protein
MATNQKRVIVLAALVLGASILYVFGPVVGCWYNEYRFNRYVHVQIDVPSCAATLSEPVSGPCRYIFSFDAEREPKAIQFEGNGLHYSFDSTKRTYNVTGLGRVINRSNVIELAPSQVLFNNQALPGASQPSLVFVGKDGHPISGYCELRW